MKKFIASTLAAVMLLASLQFSVTAKGSDNTSDVATSDLQAQKSDLAAQKNDKKKEEIKSQTDATAVDVTVPAEKTLPVLRSDGNVQIIYTGTLPAATEAEAPVATDATIDFSITPTLNNETSLNISTSLSSSSMPYLYSTSNPATYTGSQLIICPTAYANQVVDEIGCIVSLYYYDQEDLCWLFSNNTRVSNTNTDKLSAVASFYVDPNTYYQYQCLYYIKHNGYTIYY